eukprot:snap_masked-scaffold_2-processed-gene-0.38-mRNA-1 protein AED:1.00 eAED:1.00 QI:0/-1/0/0/-1/1/1/0/179
MGKLSRYRKKKPLIKDFDQLIGQKDNFNDPLQLNQDDKAISVDGFILTEESKNQKHKLFSRIAEHQEKYEQIEKVRKNRKRNVRNKEKKLNNNIVGFRDLAVMIKKQEPKKKKTKSKSKLDLQERKEKPKLKRFQQKENKNQTFSELRMNGIREVAVKPPSFSERLSKDRFKKLKLNIK